MENYFYRDVLESLDTAVCVRDLYRRIIYLNGKARELTGCPDEHAESFNCYDLIGDENRACKDNCIIDRVIFNGEPINNIQRTIKTKDGRTVKLHLSSSPYIVDKSISGAVIMLNQISGMINTEKSQESADDIKGSLNIYEIYDESAKYCDKDYFLERLESDFHIAKRHRIPLSLLFLELDDFRNIKKDFGETYCNSLTRQIVDMLKSRLRRSDLIFSYSEGQLAIILHHTGANAAARLAEEIRKAIQEVFRGGGENYTVSIGVADLRDDMGKPLDLVSLAVQSVDKARKTGNMSVFPD